jgi:uncharacterized membrane protein
VKRKTEKNNLNKRMKKVTTVVLTVLLMGAMFAGLVNIMDMTPIERAMGDSGGPDGYGYTWTNSTGSPQVPSMWVDGITGGTPLGLNDDSWFGPVSMGISFTYYGVTYTDVYIMSNGWISFVDQDNWFQVEDFPGNTSFQGAISPYSRDLNPSASGEIYVKSISGTPDQFIITWDAVPHWSTSDFQTFQIVLNETGEIWFNYQNMNNADPSANIGIENEDSTIGLDYESMASTPFSGLSILFEYNPPPYLVQAIPGFQTEFDYPGQTIDYVITIENLGSSNDTYDLSASYVWPLTFRDLGDTMNITSINVSAQSSEDFLVRINIPGGALSGDSDIADILINSTGNPLLNYTVSIGSGVPLSAPWFDDFEYGVFGGTTGINWSTNTPVWVNVGTHTSLSGIYSMFTNGGRVNVTSFGVNTTGLSSLEIHTWIRRGNSFSEDPDTGDDLQIFYKNDVGSWILLGTFLGNGTPGEISKLRYILPPDAMHPAFQLRFSQAWGNGVGFDFWHIDDVYIGPQLPYDFEIIPGDQELSGDIGTIVDYIYTINNTGMNNDTYNLSVTQNTWSVAIRNLIDTTDITNLSVLAGNISSFIVRVTIPGGALPGDYDFANITINSQNDSLVSEVVSVTTRAELSPPWLDNFEFGTLGGTTGINWSTSDTNFVGVNLDTSNSGFYSMYTSGATVSVTSRDMNTSKLSGLEIGCWIRRGADSFSEDPDGGENLEIYYINRTGVWIRLDEFLGSGVVGEIYNVRYILPADALHNNFQLRFNQTGGNGIGFDFWHIDDVYVREPQPYLVEVTPESQTSLGDLGNDVDYILNISNWGTENDTYNIIFSSNWSVTLRDEMDTMDISTISLISGSSMNIIVRVTIPFGANPGEKDDTLITVESQNDSAVNDTFSATTFLPITPPWFDYIESGEGVWEKWDDANATQWELGDPSSWPWGPASAFTPSNCWGTNIAGNYTTDGEATLTSAFVDLRTISNARLSFRHWYDINGNWNDGAWVEISLDFGASWFRVNPIGSYPDRDWMGRQCYAGSSSGWQLAEFDLSSYYSNIIQMRFNFIDFSSDGLERAGWYIDDISITQTTGSTSATATGPLGGPSNIGSITITYSTLGSPSSVHLYYTKDTEAPYSWTFLGTDSFVDGSFFWNIPSEGTYSWFARSSEEPLPVSSDIPQASSYIYDLTPPEILSTVPVNSAIDVPINQFIIITFSEPMDNASLGFLCNPDPFGWMQFWNETNEVVTLIHANFAVSTLQTFTVTSVSDLAGNFLVAGSISNPWNFTTEITDTRPPSVYLAEPVGLDVLINDNIIIIFNETMDTASVENSFSYSDGTSTWTVSDGGVSWNSPTNNRMTFNPSVDFDFSETITVTIDADIAKDLNSNFLDGNTNGVSEGAPSDNYVWSFTIEDMGDIFAPNSSIVGLTEFQNSLTFSIPWNATDSTGILYVELFYTTDGGTSWFKYGGTYTTSPISFSAIGEGVYGFYTVATDNSTNTNRESEPNPGTLPYATTLVDTISPVIDAGVDVYTNIEINADSTVSESGSGIGTISWAMVSGPGNITFGAPNELSTSVSANVEGIYVLRLTITDNASNTAFDEISFSWDLTPPTGSGMPIGSGNSIYSDIIITFSEPMARASVEAAFTINPSVQGSFIWTMAGAEVTFDPLTFLYSDTEYTVYLDSASVYDLAGNPMTDDLVWTFTTGTDVTGNLRGTVEDENGNGVEGATVTIKGTSFSTTTDSDGEYSFSNVPVGSYEIVIKKVNYKDASTQALVQPYQTTVVSPITMEEEETGFNFLWLILLIIVIIIVVLFLIIFLGKRQKKEQQPYQGYPQYPQQQTPPPTGEPLAPGQYPPPSQEAPPPAGEPIAPGQYPPPPDSTHAFEHQEGVPQEAPPLEGTQQEAPPPIGPEKETPQTDEPTQDAPTSDQSPQDTPQTDQTSQDGPPSEQQPQEEPQSQETPQESETPPPSDEAPPSQGPTQQASEGSVKTSQPAGNVRTCINCQQPFSADLLVCPFCSWNQNTQLPPPPPGSP